MRCMKRNMRKFYYANFVERRMTENANGLKTGEQGVTYTDPILCEANISPVSGIVSAQIFGTSEGYDKVLVMDKPDISLDEYSILWLDTTPNAPPDYIVKRVARSLNSVAIAVSKVNVRNG